jgi:outer membrane protein OmpA-like peptidoglycan-associated protein
VLTPGDKDQIKKAAAQIAKYHYSTIYLNGYTDLRASIAYNIALSQSRNDAVASYLMMQLKTYNISEINLVKAANGITKASPVLALNRKVTITN